jgi:hypothetical protein
MSARGEKLTRKQEAAVAALLTQPTHALAAAAAGIAESTLTRWLHRPDFLIAYRAARREVVEHAVARLQQAGGQAVETLRASLAAERPADQIRAACAVINYALRGLEVADLVERVAELERVVAERREADREPCDLDREGVPPVNGAGPRDADAGGSPPPGPVGDAAAQPGPPVSDGGTDPGPLAKRRLLLDSDGPRPDPLF